MSLIINSDKYKYDARTKTFSVDGRKVSFATQYTLKNLKTGTTMDFALDHSTGSEWDPYTIWVYTNGDFKLHVGNQDVTPAHAASYLKAKLSYLSN